MFPKLCARILPKREHELQVVKKQQSWIRLKIVPVLWSLARILPPIMTHARLILLNKPFGVLSQFTTESGHACLADYISEKRVYPAGRLDKDSEGLLLLTDNGGLQARIAEPRYKLPKSYWAQVEGLINDRALATLEGGLDLKDGPTAPAQVRAIEEPSLWPRNPPIRERKNIPTSWLEVTITEGRNRQVRRMLAATGFPVLRLVRVSVGQWQLDGLAPGDSRSLTVELPASPRSSRTRPDKRRTALR